MYACERCARSIRLEQSIAAAERDGAQATAESSHVDNFTEGDVAARLGYIDATDIRDAVAKLAHTPITKQSRKQPGLFDMLSSAPGNPPVDHPLCERCARTVIADLADSITRLTRERDILDGSATAAIEPQPCDLGDTRASYKRAERELCEVDDVCKTHKHAEAALAADEAAVAADEEACVAADSAQRAHTDTSLRVDQCEMRLASLLAREDDAWATQQRLDATNVFADAFEIEIGRMFGTISGLRLGRNGRETVGWHELNAELGQMALLVTVLARRMGVVFDECVASNQLSHRAPRIDISRRAATARCRGI